MATPVTSSAPKGKAGPDLLRPARYAKSAIDGTFGGFWDGMSRFGNKGFWAGLGLGILAGIAGGGIGYVMMFAVGGLVTGAVAGSAIGALKGGYNNIGREHRRDKYADELAERQTARAAREARSQGTGHTHRDYYEKRKAVSNYNFERQLQQERENDRDYGTFWQDRVDSSRNGGYGRGY